MAKEYARKFYSSQAWNNCREEYKKKVNYLCERCLAKGIYKHGDIVHHKIFISPNNINDPKITLDHDNLEYVCRDCHAEIHIAKKEAYREAYKAKKIFRYYKRSGRRYKISDDGKILTPPINEK